jgi:hypothetical protein
MKVKVGNRIYDSENEPVMVILSKSDRENIANMLPEETKYCSYPPIDVWTKDDYQAMKEWMNEVDHSMTNPCSEVVLDAYEFNPWYETTKEEIYNAMLMPGEYIEKDGKFYIKRGMLDGCICDEYYQSLEAQKKGEV